MECTGVCYDMYGVMEYAPYNSGAGLGDPEWSDGVPLPITAEQD